MSILKQGNTTSRLTNGSYAYMDHLLESCHVVQQGVKTLHYTVTRITSQPCGCHNLQTDSPWPFMTCI